MRAIAAATLPLVMALAACALPAARSAAPEGSAVALNRPVRVGGMVVTPTALVEDSRCPMNARCIWAGRVRVAVDIASGADHDRAELTLGDATPVTTPVRLTSASPERMAGQTVRPRDYRFTFDMTR